MPASSYLATNTLNAWIRATPPANFPTNVYVGLFLTNPGPSGTGTEVSGNGYARAGATFGAPASSAGSMVSSNSSPVSFPSATGSWGTPQYFAIYDALTGGNMLFYGIISAPFAISSGMTPQYATGSLRVSAS